jgi:hypothetical protein
MWRLRGCVALTVLCTESMEARSWLESAPGCRGFRAKYALSLPWRTLNLDPRGIPGLASPWLLSHCVTLGKSFNLTVPVSYSTKCS